MSARDALLAAVLTNPDDDTVRLVFADALEETGAPVAIARARFIRLQIGITAVGRDALQELPNAFESAQEIDSLARHWARAWLTELPPALADAVWKLRLGAFAFRRGFVDGVTLPTALFRDAASELFAVTPVTALHLHGGLGASQTADLFACPYFRRLRSVRLSGGAIGARVARRLAKCSDLGAVRELDLSGCGLSDSGALDLAKFVARGTLDVLCVRGNRLTTFGLDALASAVPVTGPTRIDVSANPGTRWLAGRRREYENRLVF